MGDGGGGDSDWMGDGGGGEVTGWVMVEVLK